MSTSASGIGVAAARGASLTVSRTGLLTGRRRKLQLVLGFIWLVDATLQFQPAMFSRDFVTGVLEPAAAGTPWAVEGPSLWAAHLMLPHIAIDNAFFASIQLAIALALMSRQLVRVGLAVSVVWALGIWWLAEGIGGITVGASPVMGAPGAALIYAVIALLVWPRASSGEAGVGGRSVAESGALGRILPRVLWAALWLGLAVLGLQADNRTPSGLHDLVTGMAGGEPGWIQHLDRWLGAPLAGRGTGASIVLAVLFAATALGVFGARTRRPALVVAMLLGAVIWLMEDFGGVFTGSGTDVNSGPLLMLLAAAFWPLGHRLPARR